MKRHVEIESNGYTLRGYLHLPDNIKNPPLVCIFHGFTGNKMEDHFYFVRLSRELESKGVASLRMDFMGSGESDGNFVDMTPETEIEDGKNIIDWAYNLKEIDKNNISIFGFSMGGMVGAIVASERSNKVKSLCIASPAANLEDIFESYFKDLKEQYVNVNGLMLSRKALENIKSIDTIERAKDFDGNVLIIQGMEDSTVPPEVSERYKRIYGSRVNYFYIQGADHGYRDKQQEDILINKICDYFKE